MLTDVRGKGETDWEKGMEGGSCGEGTACFFLAPGVVDAFFFVLFRVLIPLVTALRVRQAAAEGNGNAAWSGRRGN